MTDVDIAAAPALSRPALGTPAFTALLLAATLVRFVSLPLPGMEDMGVWRVWSYAASRDLIGVYGIGGDPLERRLMKFGKWETTTDYPPLAMAESALVGVVYRDLFPDYPDDRRLNAAVKVPGFIAGAALTALLYVSLHALTGSVGAAQFAALAFWANPTLILNAEVLGYLDPLMMLPAVLSLLCLHLRRPWLGGVLLGLAMLTKPQAMLVSPAFLLAAWHTGGLRAIVRSAVSGATTLVTVSLPWLLAGAFWNMMLAFGSWQARRDILSGNAANAWWVATWLARGYNMIPGWGFPGAYFEQVRRILAISSWMEMGLPNPRPFGTALVLVAAAWGAWTVWKSASPAVHFAFAAFTVQSFFVWGVSVHEHHMMLAVPMLAVAATLDRTWLGIFLAASAICALNMNLFYGIGMGVGYALPRMITPIDFSVLLAFANIALFVWTARVLARTANLRVEPSC